MRTLTLAFIVVFGGIRPGWSNDIRFVEDFALSGNREEALKKLIPGTEDYYFYHCLHYETTGRLEKIAPLLKLWIKRYGRTARVLEIEKPKVAIDLSNREPQESRDLSLVHLPAVHRPPHGVGLVIRTQVPSRGVAGEALREGA